MAVGFLSGLGRLGISIGTSYFGSRLAEKRQLGNVKALAIAGRSNGRVPERGGGFRRPKGLPPGPTPVEAVVGPGSTVPAWHELIHEATRRKRRRMDFGNTRALTRALRRAEGFTRLVKRTNKAIRRIAR